MLLLSHSTLPSFRMKGTQQQRMVSIEDPERLSPAEKLLDKTNRLSKDAMVDVSSNNKSRFQIDTASSWGSNRCEQIKHHNNKILSPAYASEINVPYMLKLWNHLLKCFNNAEHSIKNQAYKSRLFERQLSMKLSILQQAQIELLEGSHPESKQRRKRSLKLYGSMGTALFSPLDAVHEAHFDDDSLSSQDCYNKEDDSPADDDSDTSSMSSLPLFEEEHEDVTVAPILSISIKKQIHSQLPFTLQYQRWSRIYCTSRDGDSFVTFLTKVKNYPKTLLAVKTSCGEIFGGYADCCWEQQNKSSCCGGCYYGTGQSFLFSVCDDGNNIPKTQVYRWTGLNPYWQYINCPGERIAMGGGGHDSSFGFCLQDYFTRGSTGHCDTYGNPPLVAHDVRGADSDGGYYEVLDFEVYGFSPGGF